MSNGPENQRKALGKGLSSLLPPRSSGATAALAPESIPSAPITKLPIDAIEANPYQPRSTFDADKLRELAQSIRANGIIQPLIIRKFGSGYQIVAGERRWRAAKLAQLSEVPVVVQDLADNRILEIALIENLQREDLNPLETAQAFERLVIDHGLSHEDIGNRTGKDRSTITNMLRLLRLPSDIQMMLADRRLSMGHARAILALPEEELQREVAEKAASQGLNVRQVEQLVQKMTKSREPKPLKEDAPQDPNVKAAVVELETALGTKVRIVEKSAGKGRIEIDYFSAEELDRIYWIIVGDKI
jgi:ParB family chromosome partitioning protein